MWFCEKAAECRGVDIPKKNLSDPVTRAKAETAYDAVLQSLYSYALAPGQHLSDQDLAFKLNIGRTPIREALIRLAAEEKIIALPKRGYFTRPLIEHALMDSYVVAREILAFALLRGRPQARYQTARCDEESPAKLAFRAEAIFTEIAQKSSNCEICHIIEKFSFCTHPLRVAITTSQRSISFRRSLDGLADAMAQLGNATSVVKSALMSHLDLEQGFLSDVVQDINARWLTSTTLAARSS
ncbi:GntR family transcriptional regulator [Rhizobium calliandrae]|uniref:GntR family transcriptional regulator n=1 Tax=Rhizobium calliandrae TaxID=1312182 RepID=A0ABT7KMZ8_9HYPH|nr:GntR family transcriptional regulator [Rhizobium calliandrae]MDL2409796.1 GntR family transcriptional regulator [Rhizobium calliandrae]